MTADAPDEPESDPIPSDDEEAGGEPKGSLLDDVGALIEDGRTYAEAELAFQKTRLFYVLANARSIAILSGITAALVVLAIVALVVGAVIGLIPELGPWGAAGVVAAALLVVAALLGLTARAKLKGLGKVFEADGDGE